MLPIENSFHLNLDRNHIKNLEKYNNNVIRSELHLRDLLESTSKTYEIDSLQPLFSRIGIYLLSNPQNSVMIIKFKPLYDKIRTVLSQGQTSKMKTTLNLISSLMFIGLNSNNQSQKGVLRMHTQNMIRISGCLLTMTHLFSNCMMQHETWSALCQSLSETCYKSVLNQSYCSHLVPLCIKRCRVGNPEALSVLQSLLIDHEKNVQIFYESQGMSIFSRETLLYTTYLQTLNTVIESTKQTQQDYIRKSKMIFKYLQGWLHTDENNSPVVQNIKRVTQWAAIILYSRRKLLGTDAELSDEEFNEKSHYVPNREFSQEAEPDYTEKPHSDTRDLLQNVIKEVYQWNTQNSGNKKRNRLNMYGFKQNVNNDQNNNLNKCNPNKKPTLFLSPKKDLYRKGATPNSCKYMNTRSIDTCRGESVLSFSFLGDQSNNNDISKPARRNSTCMLRNSKYRESNPFIEVPNNFYADKDTFNRTTCTLTEQEPIIEFKPPFVSTPKKLNRLKIIQNTNKIKKRKHNFKKASVTKSDVKNRSMGAKFMDMINGSYSTVVRSISRIKSVFVSNDKDEDNSVSKMTERDNCSYSFTNYMRERDARIANEAKSKEKEVSLSGSDFSNAGSSCVTCNDTLALKHKLSNDPSLKESVKKLKMGINLYGCDFKKISLVLWAREPYMTPDVLYTLYRKLIAK